MFGYMGKKLTSEDTVEGEVKMFDIPQIFGHIGLAMLVFEGNGSIINVRAESKNPQRFTKVFTAAIISVIVLFMVFSSIAYITYKDDCKSIFVLSL